MVTLISGHWQLYIYVYLLKGKLLEIRKQGSSKNHNLLIFRFLYFLA